MNAYSKTIGTLAGLTLAASVWAQTGASSGVGTSTGTMPSQTAPGVPAATPPIGSTTTTPPNPVPTVSPVPTLVPGRAPAIGR